MAKKKIESLIVGSDHKDVWSGFGVEKEETEVYDRCHIYTLRCMGAWGMCCPKRFACCEDYTLRHIKTLTRSLSGGLDCSASPWS